MAEEAGTTQEAAPAAAEQKPALKYSQADLDNITEKVRLSTEAKIKADLEQQKKDAELSEVDKLRKQLADVGVIFCSASWSVSCPFMWSSSWA